MSVFKAEAGEILKQVPVVVYEEKPDPINNTLFALLASGEAVVSVITETVAGVWTTVEKVGAGGHVKLYESTP